MQKFRKVEMEMVRADSYGKYYITAHYRGRYIKACTNDSEAWDWFDNEGDTKEEREKHGEALRHCYYKIVCEFEKLK